jgi:hypothetical protein
MALTRKPTDTDVVSLLAGLGLVEDPQDRRDFPRAIVESLHVWVVNATNDPITLETWRHFNP